MISPGPISITVMVFILVVSIFNLVLIPFLLIFFGWPEPGFSAMAKTMIILNLVFIFGCRSKIIELRKGLIPND